MVLKMGCRFILRMGSAHPPIALLGYVPRAKNEALACLTDAGPLDVGGEPEFRVRKATQRWWAQIAFDFA